MNSIGSQSNLWKKNVNNTDEGAGAMVQWTNWGQCYKQVELWRPVAWVHRHSWKHLRSSLGVSDISSFLDTSSFESILNLSRGIKLSHLSEWKWPVIFGWGGKCGVTNWVFRSSLVSKPNIVSCSDELECWSNFSVIHNPAVSRIHNSVLQKSNWSSRFCVGAFDSKQT